MGLDRRKKLDESRPRFSSITMRTANDGCVVLVGFQKTVRCAEQRHETVDLLKTGQPYQHTVMD